MKGYCPSLNLVTTLSLYVEHRLRYYKFTIYILIIQDCIMSCHGNGAISHSPNSFLLGDKNCSHSVSPSEHFGIHKTLSLLGRGGVGRGHAK